MFVGHESARSVLKCGVPQSSVLAPLLFTLYTHPLSAVICQSGLSYHFFADDSQLHKSSAPSDFPVLACCLKDCIEDVAEWMGDSKLKVNDDKTVFVAIECLICMCVAFLHLHLFRATEHVSRGKAL